MQVLKPRTADAVVPHLLSHERAQFERQIGLNGNTFYCPLIQRDANGSLSVGNIDNPRAEMFYWVTILISNTLGTALGDFVATDAGLGFQRGALVFAALIGLVALLHFFTKLPKSVLFWAAYVLTRPLGATLGDTLTKPQAQGGLNLSRITSSLVIAAVMIVLIAVTSLRNRPATGQQAAA